MMSGATVQYKPYPAYRPSGVEWLGDVPGHWRAIRFRYSCSVVEGQVDPRLDEFGSLVLIAPNHVESATGRILYTETASEQAAISGKYLVRPGDVIYSKIRPALNKVCPSPGRCLCSADMYPVRPRGSLTGRYLLYYMLSRPFVQRMTDESMRVAMPKVNREKLGDCEVLHPSLPEQRAIADFLDRETGRIDALIAKKRRLIELLEEKRSALISHAVTKGLDPNVPMKDSGIEWLGEIPEHWEAGQLGHYTQVQSGLTLGKRYEGDDLVSRPYLRVANVQDGFLDLAEITEIQLPSSETARYQLLAGDVLMTEGGDFDKLGRGCVWAGELSGCLHQNHVFAVRPNPKRLLPAFLAALTASAAGKFYFTSTSQQSTNLATTNRTKIKAFAIPLPSLGEQHAIVASIERESARIDMLIWKNREVIDKLQEYRTALISAAVTGKIDVREEVSRT